MLSKTLYASRLDTIYIIHTKQSKRDIFIKCTGSFPAHAQYTQSQLQRSPKLYYAPRLDTICIIHTKQSKRDIFFKKKQKVLIFLKLIHAQSVILASNPLKILAFAKKRDIFDRKIFSVKTKSMFTVSV